jgi:hypothetical protein
MIRYNVIKGELEGGMNDEEDEVTNMVDPRRKNEPNRDIP